MSDIQPKDVKMGIISVETKVCYREHKHPAGHPDRACHVGLQTLDLRICRHCTWLGTVGNKAVATLTDSHLMRLAGFLKSLRDEKPDDTQDGESDEESGHDAETVVEPSKAGGTL